MARLILFYTANFKQNGQIRLKRGVNNFIYTQNSTKVFVSYLILNC